MNKDEMAAEIFIQAANTPMPNASLFPLEYLEEKIKEMAVGAYFFADIFFEVQAERNAQATTEGKDDT